MRRIFWTVLIMLALAGVAKAGNMFFFNVGSNGGTPLAACGSGVIDLSTGCIVTVLP